MAVPYEWFEGGTDKHGGIPILRLGKVLFLPHSPVPGFFYFSSAIIIICQQALEDDIFVVLRIEMRRDPELPEVVQAMKRPGPLHRFLHRRDQQGGQDRDDRNHHQKLDQRKPCAFHSNIFHEAASQSAANSRPYGGAGFEIPTS